MYLSRVTLGPYLDIYIGLSCKVSGTASSTTQPPTNQQNSKKLLLKPLVRSFLLYILFMQVYKHGGNYNIQMGHSALDNMLL